MAAEGHDHDGVHAHLHAATAFDELKYLGFVEAVGGVATVCVVRIYEVAKEWSGSWRPRINEVEVKVREVVAPMYYLVRGQEHQILLFFDHKLDVLVCTVQKHAPHVLKGCCERAVEVVKKVPDFVVDVSAEVQRVGVVDTTKSYFNKFEPLAEEWIHLGWKQFLKLPFSLTVVHITSPPALFLGGKVNQLLSSLKELNTPFADYVPLLPLKRIESIIKKEA